MKHISLRTGLLYFLCICFGISCGNHEVKTENPSAVGLQDINSITTELPEFPGYQTFSMNCLTCHSASYISNQPNLPEKTWAAIVTKMQKTFGAPVSDSSAKEIIQYLAAIKGKS